MPQPRIEPGVEVRVRNGRQWSGARHKGRNQRRGKEQAWSRSTVGVRAGARAGARQEPGAQQESETGLDVDCRRQTRAGSNVAEAGSLHSCLDSPLRSLPGLSSKSKPIRQPQALVALTGLPVDWQDFAAFISHGGNKGMSEIQGALRLRF
ncbi:phosphatidylinositol 4-phosphate 5-kinase-like protein 1 [Platysternon megacephalum]|uniref:Phosphatidylinositol 4-phosphate 5-kinase-like protein 1 n=1 Tax=Platysternon megacephalum TaxID=55544 RepID=A0A4D9ETL4_9SAUR|nr:phosphatidylinositol 4-phosphate 5-kinase-like protein 1 [Platysternon megacephalum]